MLTSRIPHRPQAPAASARSSTGRASAGRASHALAALALVAVLLLPATAGAWTPNAYAATAERDLRTLTNQARASAGRTPLRLNATLATTARGRSRDMAVRDYFSHVTPDGTMVFDQLDTLRFCYRLAGENIGYTTHPDAVAVAAVQRMFMDSPTHRANIMGKAWDSIGIGAYSLDGTRMLYAVVFADRC